MPEISRARFLLATVVVALIAWVAGRALAPAVPAGAGGERVGALVSRAPAGERADPAGTVAAAAPVVRPPSRAIVVHVAGAVRRPGIVRLREGDRFADALTRAGGAARGADLEAVNLAARARDGVQLLVPRRAAARAGADPGLGAAGGAGPGGASAGTAGPGGATGATGVAVVINLNTATAEQLDTLDGVGPATAAKILRFRAEHGPFRSVDDLEQIPGIGPKRLAAMRPRVRV